MQIRRALIKKKAMELLNLCNINEAPISVEKCARELKAIIRFEPLEGNVSGLIHLNTSGNPIIGINSFHPETRKRFSIAHELGHLVLHSKFENDLYIDDEKLSYVAFRDEKSSEGTDVKEIEANLFAAELLMPEEFLVEDFIKAVKEYSDAEDAIGVLAERYQVSIQALTIRLNKLGMII